MPGDDNDTRLDAPEPEDADSPSGSGDGPSATAKRGFRKRSLAARKAARTRAENARLAGLWKHERELWQAGHKLIAGVDESGVGPLAGPVVAAAVILPADFEARGLWECKRLLADKRPHFHDLIRAQARCVGVGIVEVDELDRINIHQAALKAMRLALGQLTLEPDCALVDGFVVPGLTLFQRPIVDGDVYSISIAAASVIAKVTRDRIMERLDRIYPGYGFAHHKGYGTREHRQALEQLGPCPCHRRSFAPIQNLVADEADLEDLEKAAAESAAVGAADGAQRILPLMDADERG